MKPFKLLLLTLLLPFTVLAFDVDTPQFQDDLSYDVELVAPSPEVVAVSFEFDSFAYSWQIFAEPLNLNSQADLPSTIDLAAVNYQPGLKQLRQNDRWRNGNDMYVYKYIKPRSYIPLSDKRSIYRLSDIS